LDLNSFTEDESTGAGGAMSAPAAGRRGDRVEAIRRLRAHCELRTTTSGASIEALASGARGGQDPGSTLASAERSKAATASERWFSATRWPSISSTNSSPHVCSPTPGRIRLTDAERDAPYDDLKRARELGISLQRLDRGTPVTDRRSCDADGRRPGSLARG